jgi:hypothetical protein
MSGKKGMIRKEPDPYSGRARMWRIMRRRQVFSIDDLVIPLDGVTTSNSLKFIQNLVRHGIVKLDGWNGTPGKRGSCKVFRLINNTGPIQPTQCPTCKQPISAKTCGGES